MMRDRAHKGWTAGLRRALEGSRFHALRDGSWLRRVVTAHVKSHRERVAPERWTALYPKLGVEERASREIGRAARRAAAAGATASVGASAGELLALLTEGLAAPVAVPATLLAMGLEAAKTAVLHIELVCDLASIYGVPFDPDDMGEVATLMSLALDVDMHAQQPREPRLAHPEDEAPQGLVAKLIELQEGEIAGRLGRVMIEESLLKNVVPILGVAISARWNYVATLKLAAAARHYVRYRAALGHTVDRLRLGAVTDPAVVIEGAWLLATVDGPAKHEETMAIAGIVSALFDKRFVEIDVSLGRDEEEWFDGLARLQRDMRATLLDVLYLVAATDREVQESERRFLRRVGRALSVGIDFDRIDLICDHFARGCALPSGFFQAPS